MTIKRFAKKLLSTLGMQVCGANRLGVDFWHDLKRLDLNPTVVFDVGANVGQWASACRAALPGVRIFSFEPEPVAFQGLTMAFRGDELHAAHNMALSSKRGRAHLRVSKYPTMHSLEETFENQSDGSVEVIIETLDLFLASVPEKRISLLKIDVEGHELQCLEGAASTLAAGRIDVIFIEVGFDGGSHTPLASIESLLRPYKFHFLALYDIVPEYRRAEVMYCNALFVREGIVLN